jgi:hypothetical protein
MLYIQRRCGRQLETVDQCNSKTEAKHLQTEYQLSDSMQRTTSVAELAKLGTITNHEGL